MTPPKVAVVLMQLGGPDSLEAIEPFLTNLFSDPEIIELPLTRLARRPLARLIARNRSRKVRSHYAAIGGGSPILAWTGRQAQALERELRRQLDARVFVAMRYWHPLTAEVVAQVTDWEPDELVLLPLYPQYSRVTSGSSLKEWHRQWVPYSARARVRVLRGFYQHPLYVEAVVEKIEQTLARFPRGARVSLVFSAHSVPASVIAAGDPYRDQIEATVERVCKRGAWNLPVRLCYQSKAGPGRWIEPMLHPTLRELAGGGSSHVLIVPISFVSEHIETLYEIDIEARELAGGLGFTQFEMMPALDDSPSFIAALAGLVRESLKTEEEKCSAALDTRGEATIDSISRQK